MSDPVCHYEFQWLGRISYADALARQERLVEKRRSGEIGDTILLLEHEPVYTIGRTRDRSSLERSAHLPHPVIETNRGGQATYHGPGQLVGYPILDLRNHGQDLHAYLRCLEEAIITFAESHGIPAERCEGLTGVWVGRRKLASLGVGVRHWISMHGFALNVGSDLAGFDAIIPCGIRNVEMTSIECQRRVKANADESSPLSVEHVAQQMQEHLTTALAKLRRMTSGSAA